MEEDKYHILNLMLVYKVLMGWLFLQQAQTASTTFKSLNYLICDSGI